MDIAQAWKEFENTENVSIVMELRLTEHNRRPDVLLTAKATQLDKEGMEVKQSGYMSASCLATRLMTLEALVFRALYVLDFQNAEQEYAAQKTPEA